MKIDLFSSASKPVPITLRKKQTRIYITREAESADRTQVATAVLMWVLSTALISVDNVANKTNSILTKDP